MRKAIGWVVLLAIVAALVILVMPDGKKAVAITVCGECGLSAAQVQQFIDDCANSVLDRAGLFKLWEDTYEEKAELDLAREDCGACVRAILDAAEVS